MDSLKERIKKAKEIADEFVAVLNDRDYVVDNLRAIERPNLIVNSLVGAENLIRANNNYETTIAELTERQNKAQEFIDFHRSNEEGSLYCLLSGDHTDIYKQERSLRFGVQSGDYQFFIDEGELYFQKSNQPKVEYKSKEITTVEAYFDQAKRIIEAKQPRAQISGIDYAQLLTQTALIFALHDIRTAIYETQPQY